MAGAGPVRDLTKGKRNPKTHTGKKNLKVSAVGCGCMAFAEWSVVLVTVSEDQISSWQQKKHWHEAVPSQLLSSF